MRSRALPLALVISGVLHAGVIAVSHEAAPTLTPDPALVYSTQLEAVLVDAVQDKGETLLPSEAAAESVAVAHEVGPIDELKHEVGRLEELAASLQSRLEEVEAQRYAEKARHDREMLALRDSNETRESGRRNVEAQVADLEDAHQTLSAENASLAKILADTESDLQATANAEAVWKAQVQTLASELQSQQDAHRRLKEKDRKSQDARQALQAQKQNTDSENERLVARLSENELALATARLDRQAMTEEHVALNQAMQVISSELKNQHDANQRLRDEADQVNETLAALAHEKDKTEATHDDVAARLLETASTLQTLSKENEELQKMLLRSEETAADLRQQLDNAQASTASLETGNALTELRPVPATGNPKPAYPRLAIRRGIEGDVSLSVSVSSSGQVSGVTVSKPSGFSILDRAAVDSVRQWQFTPATRDGMPTAMVIDIPVQFRLIDARG